MKNILKSIATFLIVFALCFSSSCNGENGKTDVFEIEFTSEASVLVVGAEGFDKTAYSAKVLLNEAETDKACEVTASNDCVKIENENIVATSAGETVITAKYGEVEEQINIEVLEKKSLDAVTDESVINYFGRVKLENGCASIHNTASGLEVNFIGSKLSASIKSYGSKIGSFAVIADGKKEYRTIPVGSDKVTIFDGESGIHDVKFLKMCEQSVYRCDIFSLNSDGEFLSANKKPELKFEFYGDSITCGYGNLLENSGYENDQDGTETYATMLADMFGAQYSCISYSGITGGIPLKGDTRTIYDFFDTYSETDRTKYDFSKYQADLVVVNLGTNDTNAIDYRGDDEMINGYSKFISALRKKQPNAFILCCYGMMGVNERIDADIRTAVEQIIASGDRKIQYFNVSANGYGTAGHPDMEGHKQAAESLAGIVERVVKLKRK